MYISFTPGTSKESVIIDGGQLESGKKYLIAMEGAFNDSSYSPNYVYTTFKTNFPPYNGECTVNTTTGKGHSRCDEDHYHKICTVYYYISMFLWQNSEYVFEI